jgi:DNA-binding CsgD family transcriptional regulator
LLPDVPFSKREQEVLELVLQGKSNKQIAFSLDISVRTVEFHLKNIYAKFQVSSRVELILKLGYATDSPRTRTAPPFGPRGRRDETAGWSAPGGGGKIENLGYSTVDRPGETLKMEAGPIRKWIGPHLEVLSLLSVRS